QQPRVGLGELAAHERRQLLDDVEAVPDDDAAVGVDHPPTRAVRRRHVGTARGLSRPRHGREQDARDNQHSGPCPHPSPPFTNPAETVARELWYPQLQRSARSKGALPIIGPMTSKYSRERAVGSPLAKSRSPSSRCCGSHSKRVRNFPSWRIDPALGRPKVVVPATSRL